VAGISVAGISAADAAPWHGPHHRGPVVVHRHYVDRVHVERILAPRHYRVIGAPYFWQGRYVVRTHDRFGRIVLVRIDPYSGAFLGEIRL
jgi:hypothetical protein